VSTDNYITLPAARKFLRAKLGSHITTDWLSRQMDRGRIQYKIEYVSSSGSTRYWLLEEDVKSLVELMSNA